MPLPVIDMQNVVCTFNLGVDKVCLRDLAQQTPFVEYNPKKFAAATARIVDPRTTALCFASGNMVCTGAKNETMARLAARKYVYVLQSCGFDVHFHDFCIQNLVASTDVGCLLMLDEMASAFGALCSYEPDMFPGLVLRIADPKVVYLCFRSGKIVITGARNRNMIEATFRQVYADILSQFMDTRTTASNSALYRHECAHRALAKLTQDYI